LIKWGLGGSSLLFILGKPNQFMLKIFSQKEILEKEDFFVQEIQKGKVFIYPTDTLHGLGTDALNYHSVNRISVIKKRSNKPFLIIAPSFEWIFENCLIENAEIKKILFEKLPGRYSFILKLKKHKIINKNTNDQCPSIGIRMPDNWFYRLIKKSGRPFISTSINFSGEPAVQNLEDLPIEISQAVDYIIWDETLVGGKASTIIDLTSGRSKVIRE